MKSIFEEYATRVHGGTGQYVCAMMEKDVVSLIQRAKHQYVVESIDRVTTESDVDCLVLFVKADPDDDTTTGEWWKSSDKPATSGDDWIEDYGDDLYYK